MLTANPVSPATAHSASATASPPSEQSWAAEATSRRDASWSSRMRRPSASRSRPGGWPLTFPRTTSAYSLPPRSAKVSPRT